MPKYDGTGPYGGGGPRSGLRRGNCLGNLPATFNRIAKWDWEMFALMGIAILAVSNIVIFVRERGGIRRT